MRNLPRFLIALSVLVSAGLPVAVGQQPSSSQPAPGAQVKGTEVLLAVTVRDKRGNMVNSLTSADLTLTEDGRPQTITSLARESKAPLRLGLLIDTSRSILPAMNDERKAVGKFLEVMLPDDLNAPGRASEAFLLHFDRQVELLEDFSTTRDKLQNELDNIGPSGGRSRDPQGPETMDDDRSNGGRGSGASSTQLYDAIYLASNELMKVKNGRKALVVFSDGEDHGSKETMNDAIDAADKANTAIYTIYLKGQGGRSENPFPGMSRRSGGRYPGGGYPGGGYPGGGYPGGGSGRSGNDRESQADARKTLESIATRTGGRYFEARKKEDLGEIYNAIADELHDQYVLTYTPDKRINEDEYHKIVLKAKNSDLTAATREGYYMPDSK